MISEADIIRGYVLTDGYSDTHGFRCHRGKRAWCHFRGPMVEELVSRAVWVDHLGDYYVLDLECDHFVRLGGGDDVADYWIEEE